MIPDTDYITDRAANNFCDDFQVKPSSDQAPSSSKADAIEKAKKLLGG